jgi:hypothetical protein
MTTHPRRRQRRLLSPSPILYDAYSTDLYDILWTVPGSAYCLIILLPISVIGWSCGMADTLDHGNVSAVTTNAERIMAVMKWKRKEKAE